MRRYTIVACILLVISVFSFVLAAPVAVQEVREACTDAVVGGDEVIIGLGKRADEPPPPRPSTSTPNYAGGRTRPNPSVSPEAALATVNRVSNLKTMSFYEFIFSLIGRPKFWPG